MTKTYPAFYNSINHLLDDPRLPEETLFHSHCTQLSSHDRFAALGAIDVRLRQLFVLFSSRPILLDGQRIPHISVIFGLYSDCIMFQVTICAYARVKVFGIILQVLWRGVA